MRVHTVTEAPCALCGWRGCGIMGWTARINKRSLWLVNGWGFPWLLPCRECGTDFGNPAVTLTLQPDDAARVTAARVRKWGT